MINSITTTTDIAPVIMFTTTAINTVIMFTTTAIYPVIKFTTKVTITYPYLLARFHQALVLCHWDAG